MTPAEVRPYDPAWATRGRRLTAELRELLGARAIRVDHIGSTSIPGMAAKPVLDVQVSVDDLDAAAAAFDAPLSGLGFRRRPYERDHVPAGRRDDPARWAKRYWSRAQPDRVNLHVRLAGSPNERAALLFRDWLCAHPLAVAAYADFKRRLADVTADLDVYADVKDPVVDLVLSAAEEWAARGHWDLGRS